MTSESNQDSGTAAGVTEPPLWLPGTAPGESYVARAALRGPADLLEVERCPPETLFGSTIHDCLAAAAQAHPDKPAFIQLLSALPDETPQIITYRALFETVTRAANAFAAISPAPVVAIILPMLPEALIASWAAQTAGIALPINPFLEIDNVAAIMNAAGVNILVTADARSGAGIWNRLPELCARVPTLRRTLVVNGADPAQDFRTVLSACNATRLNFAPDATPDRDSCFQPTGGTTGAPKLIRMTQRRQLLNAWINGAMADCAPDGVVGHAMPNFHVGGAVVIALRAMVFGQTVLTLTADGFRNPLVIENFWALARRYKMTSVLATPTTAAAILARPEEAGSHRIKTFNCGGSTVPLELVNTFHARFGVWLREQWGMTEAHGTITGHPTHGRPPVAGSVGYNLPFHRVQVFDLDQENHFIRRCDPGERGTLVIKGLGIAAGYLDPALDAQFFVQATPDGEVWANTGDVGTMDADGYVWLFGRHKDVIVRGGHNIDPKLIEEVLATHPAVQFAAAVGQPDARKGELPVAYIQPRHGADIAAEELLALCRAQVQERAAVPVAFIFVEQMPMTAVGKISKPALRLDALRRAAVAEATAVIGDSCGFQLEVDETGKRASVIIRLDAGGAPGEALAERLRHRFAGYEFSVRIICATAAPVLIGLNAQ